MKEILPREEVRVVVTEKDRARLKRKYGRGGREMVDGGVKIHWVTIGGECF